jgi:beta-barrel assembly-enhancing protease
MRHEVKTETFLKTARLLLLGSIFLGGGVSLFPAPAWAQCLPGISCGFSISGKKGKFIEKEVTPEELAKADAATAAGLADGRSLDSAALNKGANAGTGIAMPLTERALLTMLDRIRQTWPYRATTPISFRMVGTVAYGPTAKPDNVIVVPVGLLINAKSDDEVAWVLAHEFSHIALAHFSREAKQRRLRSAVEKISSCTQAGLMLADMRFRKSGDTIKSYQANDKNLLALSTQAWAKKEIVGDFLEFYNQGLSRKQEDEADAAGLDLALKARYSDSGHGTALSYLQSQEERVGGLFKQFGNAFSGYMKMAGGQALTEINEGGNLNTVFKSFTDGLLRNAENIAFKKISSMMTASHRPAKKRLAGLGKYMDNAYADAGPPLDSTTTWLNSVRATPEYKEAAIVARAVDASRQLIPTTPCDMKTPICANSVNEGALKALAEIKPALVTRYRATPLVANTIAHLNYAVGNFAAADQQYDIANRAGAAPAPTAVSKRKGKVSNSPPALATSPINDPYMQQSLDGFSEHVDLLLRMRNYTKAKSVIALARSRFADDDKFLPALITISAQTRDVNGLAQAINRCYSSDDPALVQQCEFAFMNPAQQDKFGQLAPADQDKLMNSASNASAKARKGSGCGLPSAHEVKSAESQAEDE